MRIQRIKTLQVHPVPSHEVSPSGPFPQELFDDPEVVVDFTQAETDDGSDLPIGATSQNNYQAPRRLVCAHCEARVWEHRTGDHVCE